MEGFLSIPGREAKIPEISGADHFPLFAEKETRLHELNDMKQWVQSHNSLDLEMVKPFKYKRKSSFERLVEKVKAKHYSTFSFYEDAELEEALKGFKKNINEQY